MEAGFEPASPRVDNEVSVTYATGSFFQVLRENAARANSGRGTNATVLLSVLTI
jgi:hypothetical protein